jgi:hypothetical protein
MDFFACSDFGNRLSIYLCFQNQLSPLQSNIFSGCMPNYLQALINIAAEKDHSSLCTALPLFQGKGI